MPKTKVIAFRCPVDIVETLDQCIDPNLTNRTTFMVEALQKHIAGDVKGEIQVGTMLVELHRLAKHVDSLLAKLRVSHSAHQEDGAEPRNEVPDDLVFGDEEAFLRYDAEEIAKFEMRRAEHLREIAAVRAANKVARQNGALTSRQAFQRLGHDPTDKNAQHKHPNGSTYTYYTFCRWEDEDFYRGLGYEPNYERRRQGNGEGCWLTPIQSPAKSPDSSKIT